MKKILTAVAISLALAGTAQAQWHHHHGYHGGGGWGWAPLVIGGVVGYEISRAQQQPPVIVQQQPVIVQQPAPVVQCPQGTMPFERQGWVRNQYGQYVQGSYIECR